MRVSAVLLGLAFIALLAAVFLLIGMCRAAAAADRAAERQARPGSYRGPDSLLLLEDLEAHMKAYGNEVADLYDTTGDR